MESLFKIQDDSFGKTDCRKKIINSCERDTAKRKHWRGGVSFFRIHTNPSSELYNVRSEDSDARVFFFFCIDKRSVEKRFCVYAKNAILFLEFIGKNRVKPAVACFFFFYTRAFISSVIEVSVNIIRFVFTRLRSKYFFQRRSIWENSNGLFFSA